MTIPMDLNFMFVNNVENTRFLMLNYNNMLANNAIINQKYNYVISFIVLNNYLFYLLN